MSSIASFIRLPVSAIEELSVDYDACLENHGESVADYYWSGSVIATLLPYLDEHGIKLMESSYDDLASQLCTSQGATIFVLTPAHKEAYLHRLAPELFSSDELRDYFNQFNESDEPEIGEAMLDGIIALRESLSAIDGDSIVLLTIG